ncbi:MAG: agmatinase [Planctomycetota bacterium]|nr:agmatinase [Planctomycetota bacterium]
MPDNAQRGTQLPDSRRTPRFAGVTTFCRFPILDQGAPGTVDADALDWVIYGIPFDGGVTYRPGARFGPRAIREASQYVKPYHLELGVDIAAQLHMADAGDAPVRPYSTRETLEEAANFAGGLGNPSRTKLLAVGGDHSVAYANIRATWERRGRPEGGLPLLHFDAHLDTVDTIWDEKWTHASPFIRAIEDGLVNPKRMLSIGIRGPLNTPSDLDYGTEHGVRIITATEWFSGEGAERMDAFLAELGSDEVYLTFDIDCVDPSFAPGTGTPCPGGFSSRDALDLVRRCAGIQLAGADLVEVLPDRDPTGCTSLLAAHLLAEILALDALATTQG